MIERKLYESCMRNDRKVFAYSRKRRAMFYGRQLLDCYKGLLIADLQSLRGCWHAACCKWFKEFCKTADKEALNNQAVKPKKGRSE